ncbi:phage baseplate assembly protein V [Saccharopolyspora phatthalungensis]|uniref:Uncharacterized protein involved in type VI secretion and phage assembly n=1 Tax=Saccharopolyspora phatthalungensis TaxID=664693 RepID=A0A840QB82_9PSEU|nr:phage baseplate assembly protein V [Saccharopolyspora phatthalungensis]MBB5157041.1 uncharacterized protein involved in type VI secretion and phage assembly [Saccharopolyspora phatthalungensis]
MPHFAGQGLLVGLVIDLNDPEHLGRVKVSYPELGDARSDWARLVTPMAGKRRGMVFRPETGDEVLVGFLQGDSRAPYVLGSVWNAADPPPADDGKATENNWRFITSRCGHVIRFDDTPGKEKVEVIDKDKRCSVTIDSTRKQITIKAGSGGITLSAPEGTITLSGKTIELDATTTLKAKAGQSLGLTAGTSLEAEANTTLSATAVREVTIRGRTVDIN